MRIIVNHDTCMHGGAFSDRCLAATIRNPLGHERYCTAHVEDDGRPELTVTLTFDGQAHTLILRDETERERVALEGWPAFVRAD